MIQRIRWGLPNSQPKDEPETVVKKSLAYIQEHLLFVFFLDDLVKDFKVYVFFELCGPLCPNCLRTNWKLTME